MSESVSASTQMIDYMSLLITQLQNQNPLEPMNNQEMAAQMAQFSQLEQSELMNKNLGTLNSTFSEVLQNTELEYARSLLGNAVSFETEGSMIQGLVSEVKYTEEGLMLDVKTPYEDDEGNVEYVTSTITLDDIKSVIY